VLRVSHAIQAVNPAKTTVAIAKAAVAIAMINSGVNAKGQAEIINGIVAGLFVDWNQKRFLTFIAPKYTCAEAWQIRGALLLFQRVLPKSVLQAKDAAHKNLVRNRGYALAAASASLGAQSCCRSNSLLLHRS
jgi:hypothetical protein